MSTKENEEWTTWGNKSIPEGKKIKAFRCADCQEEFSPVRDNQGKGDAAGVVVGHNIHSHNRECTPGSIEALIR